MHRFGRLPFTLRTASAHASARCPCPGRRGGLSKESRAETGKRRYRRPHGGVYARQSAESVVVRLRQENEKASRVELGRSVRTCWLISRMAMSLRSSVNLSKAASMADVSVLLSTTRKFFWLSGGCVTCYMRDTSAGLGLRISTGRSSHGAVLKGLTPTPARRRPVTES